MENKYVDIRENILQIQDAVNEAAIKCKRNPKDIEIMAVTKTVPADAVNAAIGCGIKLLGENRVQELCEKFEIYDKEKAAIHFIGHLQTNKVRKMAGMVSMIHSVDSERLAREIDIQAGKCGKVMDVLIEINVAGEASKSGVAPGEVKSLAHSISLFPNLRLRGLMTIPPLEADEPMLEKYFSSVYELKIDIESQKIDNVFMDVLSMGMSGDYCLAIKHGATIVRIGSAIFGRRS